MKKSYNNMAFLTELLINIIVFSISCAMLTGLFVKASNIAKQTREESFAGVEIYALFETIRAEGVAGISYAEVQPDGSIRCGYTANWKPTKTQTAPYIIQISITENKNEAGLLQHLEAIASKASGKEICELKTSLYIPEERGQASG